MSSAKVESPPALRRQSAFLSSAPPGARNTGQVQCDGISKTCSYIVRAGQTLPIEITLSIALDAQPGDVVIEINGKPAGNPLAITVASALTSFRFGDENSEWNAGTTMSGVPLTAKVAEGATIGTITLQLHNGAKGDLWITGYPKNCTPVESDAIRCTGTPSSDGKSATFGSFSITPMPNADGPQPITVVLPGGRSAQVVSGDGKVIDASPLEAENSIAMAGDFGGAIVATHTMACSQAGVLRTDWGCAMQSIHSPSITVPGDGDDTIVWAGLLWAAGSVQDEKNLDSVVLRPVDSEPCDPADVDCASQQVHSAASGSDGSVQHWFGTVDVSKIHPGQTLTIDDFPADTSLSSALPMGGWALAVIWADPTADSPAHVTFTRPDAAAFPNYDRHSATADIPGGATSADILLWGTDAVGHKSIEFGDGSFDYKAWKTNDGQFSGPFSGTDDDHSIGMDSFTVSSSLAQTKITIDQYQPTNGIAHNGDTFLWDAVLAVGPDSSASES